MQVEGARAGDLDVLGELRPGVDQHIGAGLVLPLISHTADNEPATRRRYRVVRLVPVALGRLGSRCPGWKDPIPVQRVGRAAARAIGGGVVSTSRRPVPFVMPPV